MTSPASAQTCAVSALRVSVQDATGTPIPGAMVWLGDSESNAIAADDEGVAEFSNPACLALEVHARAEGFKALEQRIEIAGAEPIEAHLMLVPESVRENLEVRAAMPALEATSSETSGLHPADVKDLPAAPATVAESLARLPGLLRSPNGEINMSGAGEHHGAFVINEADVTDPGTGKFGPTLPVEVVEAFSVVNSPFLVEYGRFTSGVVATDTRRGGDKWHEELNDPFPDFRIRSGHIDGLRNSTPRALLGGPLLHDRLYLITEVQYYLDKHPNLTLPYPYNESKQEMVNAFTQFDYIISTAHFVTGSFHFAPQHINFVDPEFFNPQPVTPAFSRHDDEWTLADHLAVGGGTLVGLVAYQEFSARVWAQGDADMVLSPTGNSGNYFARQYRHSRRGEWLETWSPAPLAWMGEHDLKVGSALDVLANNGEFVANPVNLVDTSGRLLRSIDFYGSSPYSVADFSSAGFLQDHWTLRTGLMLDDGVRLERQGVAGSFRAAPRLGATWIPFKSGRTALHAGYGRFYDRVPLDVYAFNHLPQQVVTDYAPDGSIADIVSYEDVLGTDSGPHSDWVHNRHGAGGFAPRSATWKMQVDERISRHLSLQGLYENSRSAGLVDLEELAAVTNLLQLEGGGRAIYRQAELSARIEWKRGQQFFLSYVHSRAEGELNDFNSFVGDFPGPLVRPDVYSNLPADSPNRFLAWGRVSAPLEIYVLPLVEFRNGFPYASVDQLGNYVGVPNVSRYPNYFSADARLVRDFLYRKKYTLRISASAFNITDHFNPLAVHANVADPQYGVFFGNYDRRYRADFEVLF